MPQPYPDPIINQSSDLVEYANTVTEGYATTGFMFVLWVVIFMILKGKAYRTSDCFTVAFLLSFILGSLLWAMNVLQTPIIMLFLAGTIGSGLWSVFDQQ